jgi:hypothetical protein
MEVTMKVRALGPVVAGVAAALVAVSCQREPQGYESGSSPVEEPSPVPVDAAASHTASLRVVNAVPSEPATDILVGDRLAFPQVEYGDVTPYQEVPSDVVTFRARPSVPDRAGPLVEMDQHLAAGKHYTLLAMADRSGGVELSLLTDEVVPPAEGKAGLRVLNASPEPGRVDVRLGGSSRPLVSGLGGGPASSFVDVPPVRGTLVVHGDRSVLARVPDAHLEPGKRYTVLLLADAEPPKGLEAKVIDEPAPASPQS